MDVLIIIVNWNTRQLLADCIRSIYRDAGEADYEIIVVDNASSDGSAQMVRQDFGDVKLIANTENRGLAAANNQAMREAKGRYILLLNSDTIVCDGAVGKMKEYADSHPDGAVFGCQVWENSTTIQPTCFRYPSLLNMVLRGTALARTFKYNRFFGREMMLWWRRDSEREVDVVSGMFMFVRRHAIEQVGMMDESYFLYFEDTDWVPQIFKGWLEDALWSGARIIHLDGGNKSTDQQAMRMKIQFRRSMLLFFRKHYGAASFFFAGLLLAADSASRRIIRTAATILKKLGRKSIILTEVAEFLCAAIYRFFLPFTSQRPRRVVLYYHGVARRQMPAFERQMRYLARYCTVVRASDIGRVKDNSGRVIAAITFDDAFTSIADNSAEILKKYGLPATIFVPAGWLGRRPRWITDGTFDSDNGEVVMDEGRIAELSGDGFEFCSHGVSHIPLTNLQGEQLKNELIKSREILEKITGKSVSAISYPYGACNERVCEAARHAGYKTGFTIEPRMVDSSADTLAIGRFKVKPDCSMTKFRLKVSGAYQVSTYLRRAKVMLKGKRFGEAEGVEPAESYC